MTIGLPADEPQFQQKDRRLIDIEVHSDGSGLANHVYDVVWVCNQGDFELESWLVPGLTETEVNQLTSTDSIAILDIERYPEGQEWRFSAIVQRNAGKFAWDVMLVTNPTDITAEAPDRPDRAVGVRGLPEQAATTAVDGLNADWSAEAAESARAYTETMPFSRSGLVEQVVFDGFTQDEAEHGAAAALG